MRNNMTSIIISIALLMFVNGISTAATPSEVVDLSRWKLTIPYNTERKGNPDEIVQPELDNFTDSNCFFVSTEGDSVIFKAACDGEATVNSKYPRSELREMDKRGKDEASWSTDGNAIRILKANLAILETPTVRPHVVCAQIHDEEDDLIMIRLEDNELFIERNNLEDVSIDPHYKLGAKFELRIEAGQGRIKVWYNQVEKMNWAVSKQGCYYKFGCYTQSNLKKEGQPGSAGKVELSQLELIQRE